MFADDTKIFGAPGHDLQIDVNHADNWARQWQMNFNVGKCKVLHFNQDQDEYFEYEMRELNTMCKIVSTNHEKDIGVTFDNNLVVVVNLYSHSECMQHVSRNRVRTGKQPKKHKIK